MAEGVEVCTLWVEREGLGKAEGRPDSGQLLNRRSLERDKDHGRGEGREGRAGRRDVVRGVAVSVCLGRDQIRGLGEPAEARLELYKHACRFICQGGLDPAPPPTEES